MQETDQETALGAGGRKFESYRPDHLFQPLTDLTVGGFLFFANFLQTSVEL